MTEVATKKDAERLDIKIDNLAAKIEHLDAKIQLLENKMEAKFNEVDRRFNEVNANLTKLFLLIEERPTRDLLNTIKIMIAILTLASLSYPLFKLVQYLWKPLFD